MLTPEYLEQLPKTVVDLYSEAELLIIEDMARRIRKAGGITSTAVWQLERALAVEAVRGMVWRTLSQMTQIRQDVLRDLFREACGDAVGGDNAAARAAGLNPVPLADNVEVQQVINNGLLRTNGTFDNLTRTTAATAAGQFEHALDLAHTQVMSGAFDARSAIDHAIITLTTKGLKAIEYPSGHTDYLDVAVRRATLTGISQAAGAAQLTNIGQLGAKHVEVSAHLGARTDETHGITNHAWWQGRVYLLEGQNAEYANFYEATGYGQGDGLCGWNCRHSFTAFWPEFSKRRYNDEELAKMRDAAVTYNGKKVGQYEAEQVQRSLERQLRKALREEAAGVGSHENVLAARKALADFTRQTGLRRQTFREKA